MPCPSARQHRPRYLPVMLSIAALAGCADNQTTTGSAVTPEKTAPAARAAAAAHSLESLQVTGRRARPHHTVHVELQHPDGGDATLSRRVIPYTFDHPVSQLLCLDTGDSAEHRVEIHSPGSAGAIAILTRAQPCQRVSFQAGHYEAHLVHGGGASTGLPTHFFAQPRHEALDATSVMAVLLQTGTQGALEKTRGANGSARLSRKDDGDCEPMGTIGLIDNATGMFVRTDVPARYSAYHEMYRVAVAGLSVLPERQSPAGSPPGAVPASAQLTVYSCGTQIPKTLKFANHQGQFLKSQCGYPLFSASTLQEATGYQSNWNPLYQRLDLVNSETQNLVQIVDRSKGRLIGPGKSPGTAHGVWNGGDTWAGMGTCDTMPVELDSRPAPIQWVDYDPDKFNTGWSISRSDQVALARLDPQNPMTARMAAEFQYLSQGKQFYWAADLSNSFTVHNNPHRLNALIRLELEMYQPGPAHRQAFTYPPASLDAKGGFSVTQQNAIVFSTGRCGGCDLTQLDLSNRRFGTLDLSGAHLDTVNFSGAQIQSLILDNASIAGADFSQATIASASFFKATLAPNLTGSPTLFRNTVLGDPINFPANFQQATLRAVQFANTRLDGANFDRASIGQHTIVTGGTLAGTLFTNTTIDDFTLEKALAPQVNFSGSTINNLVMIGAFLGKANFSRSTITGSTFDDSYAVGADFSHVTWQDSNFDRVQAYSDGIHTTNFSYGTIVSGSFANSLFMESSFDHCNFQGGSFSQSNFLVASFNGATNSASRTGAALSFSQALLHGAKFGNASFERASFANAVISQPSFRPNSGYNLSVAIQKADPITDPGTLGSALRPYTYGGTILPASTTNQTICPNLSIGPCQGDAWLPAVPPPWLGDESLLSN